MNTESNLALHVVIRKHEADGVIALILGDHARTEPYFTMPGPACKERCLRFHRENAILDSVSLRPSAYEQRPADLSPSYACLPPGDGSPLLAASDHLPKDLLRVLAFLPDRGSPLTESAGSAIPPTTANFDRNLLSLSQAVGLTDIACFFVALKRSSVVVRTGLWIQPVDATQTRGEERFPTISDHNCAQCAIPRVSRGSSAASAFACKIPCAWEMMRSSASKFLI